MNFIDNSYHLLVYKLLSFLYGCIREDYEPADDSITPEAMNIKPGYFKYILFKRGDVYDEYFKSRNFRRLYTASY